MYNRHFTLTVMNISLLFLAKDRYNSASNSREIMFTEITFLATHKVSALLCIEAISHVHNMMKIW